MTPAVVFPEAEESFAQPASESTEPTWTNPFSSTFSWRQPATGQSHSYLFSDTRRSSSGTLSDNRLGTDTPRYRQIFGERRISLPTVPLFRFPSSSPTHSDNSTNSSKSSSYFPTRLLPSPSTTLDTSPLATFDCLSICSPRGHYNKERDPFFPQISPSCSRRESENQELIQLPPILEAIPSKGFSTESSVHKMSPTLFQPRGHMSVEDLLNPSLPLTRRSSSTF